MCFYRTASLGMAASFAGVGGLFLLAPHSVLTFFNSVSTPLGLPHAPLVGPGLWLGLAGAYMYLVTVLALSMARWPDDRRLPWLLAHAKLSSALLSLFFFAHTRYLILAINFIVDLTIGSSIVWIRQRSRR